MSKEAIEALESARAHILDAYRIWQADDVSAVPPPKSGAGAVIAKIDAVLSSPIAGEGKDIERCARLIEENIIKDTSGGKVLAPRQDGNRDGLFYATAIRALSPSSLVWRQGRRAIDDVEDYYEVARPGDKSVDGSDPFPVFTERLTTNAGEE